MLNYAKNNKFLSDRHFLTDIFLIIACSVLFISFPSNNAIQKFTGQIFFLVAVPVGYIKLILKKDLKDFGLSWGNKKDGLLWSAVGLAVILAGTYLTINYTTFANSYSLPAYIINNFWYFLLYELVFSNIFTICLIFFLCGFVLFSLAPKFSHWSIIIQSALYILYHIYFKSPYGEMIYIFVLFLILGLVTWRTKSIVYPYAIILISSILTDAYLIHFIK